MLYRVSLCRFSDFLGCGKENSNTYDLPYCDAILTTEYSPCYARSENASGIFAFIGTYRCRSPPFFGFLTLSEIQEKRRKHK